MMTATYCPITCDGCSSGLGLIDNVFSSISDNLDYCTDCQSVMLDDEKNNLTKDTVSGRINATPPSAGGPRADFRLPTPAASLPEHRVLPPSVLNLEQRSDVVRMEMDGMECVFFGTPDAQFLADVRAYHAEHNQPK